MDSTKKDQTGQPLEADQLWRGSLQLQRSKKGTPKMNITDIEAIKRSIARSPATFQEKQYYYTDELIVLEMFERPIIAIAIAVEDSSHVWLSFDGTEWTDMSYAALYETVVNRVSQDDIDYLMHRSDEAIALWHDIADLYNQKEEKLLDGWQECVTPSMTFNQALHQKVNDNEQAKKWLAELVECDDETNKNSRTLSLIKERIAFLIECYGPHHLR